jgi:hypothetical protein
VLGTEVLHLSLREVGVDLDLVDRRHHRRAAEQPAEVVDHRNMRTPLIAAMRYVEAARLTPTGPSEEGDLLLAASQPPQALALPAH